MEKYIKKGIFVISTLLIGGVGNAQQWDEIAKALPNDKHFANEMYGNSVSVDGDYAVIGAVGYDNDRGAAFVLYFNGSNWETKARLLASDGDKSDMFGNSVSISGSTVVVGAYGNDDNGSNTGSAYVFVEPSGGWTDTIETAKLMASDGNIGDDFGIAVAVYGDDVVVGAPGATIDYGQVYVFTKPLTGWVDTTETAILENDDTCLEEFGSTVAISGDVIVVGGPTNNCGWDTYNGGAYVFAKPLGGWIDTTQSATLHCSDEHSYQRLGNSVSISGNYIVVGASRDDENGWNAGAAYVYKEPISGWNGAGYEIEIAKLQPKNQLGGKYFGKSVGISGDVVVISSNDSVYVFEMPGIEWVDTTQIAHLEKTDNLGFGSSVVCVSGSHIITGASYDDDIAPNAGAAYFYNKTTPNWVNTVQFEKIYPRHPYFNMNAEFFGYSVDIDGNYAVVGSQGHENSEGIVYVYFNDGNNWIKQARLTASDHSSYDYFGSVVSISGDNIVVGAYGDDDNGNSSGSAYVFTKTGAVWRDTTETAKLKPSDGAANDYFAFDLDMSNDVIVVGAMYDNENGLGSGSAYIFKKPITGWINNTESAKILASDGFDYDNFGASVSISGDIIVVGANGDDDNGNSSGSAYVFVKPILGWIDTVESAKLLASDGALNHNFGKSTAISRSNILIGSIGNNAVYVFTEPSLGWTDATETTILKAFDGTLGQNFGYSLDISEDLVIVGAYSDNDYGSYTGSAYVFNEPSSGWGGGSLDSIKLLASDAKSYDYFGYSVAISDNYAVVGAYQKNEPISGFIDVGATYLFKYCKLSQHSFSVTSCGDYISPSGKIWTASNTYKDTIINVKGCDSIITINLTIINNSSSTVFDTAYINYTSPSGMLWSSTNTYIDTILNSIGCDSIITINLIIADSIVANLISFTNESATGNDGELSISATGGIGSLEYSINGTDFQSSGTFIGLSGGTYTVTVRDSEGNTNTITITIESSVGIHEGLIGKVSIYPNPSNGLVNIELSKSKMDISIYNELGEVIKTLSKANKQLQLELESGVYFVKVSSAEGQVIKKVVVTK